MDLGQLSLNRKSRYGLAVAVSIAALGLRAALSPFVWTHMPLQMLSLASVIAAAAGGLGPGLLATVLCAICARFFFAEPSTDHQLEVIRVGTFLLNGVGVSLIAEAMHRAFQRSRRQSAALIAAEETARRQMAEIEATYRYAPVGMCVFDADLRWVRINEKLAEINGFPPEAHLGKTVPELLPELAEAVLPPLRKVLETGEPILNYTLKGTTPARPGVERTWLESWIPVKDDAGRVRAINGVAEEVTEKLAAEETLRASEERFRTLVQASAHVVWTMGGRNGTSDPAMQRWWQDFTGLGPTPDGSVAGLEWLEAVHPEDRSTIAAIWKAAHAHARPIASEFRIRARDGEYHWFSGRMVPRKNPNGELIEWVGTLRDVTARKAAEASVRESEARFRAMFELASVGMSEVDFNTGKLVHFNERFREITGYPAEELRAIPVRLLTHPEDRAADNIVYGRAIDGSQQQYRQEKRYLRHNGEAIWVRVNASFLRDTTGRIVRSVAIVEDVTERRLAEEALQESERHYRSLFETMLQGVLYQDPKGRILSMNLAAEEILGRTREELMGETSDALENLTLDEHGDLLPGGQHPAMRALKTGLGVELQLLQFYNLRERAYRWLEVTAVPLFRDGSKEPYEVYSIFDDVTERLNTARHLQRSHDRLRLALEAAHAGTYEISLPKGEVEASLGVLWLYGFPEDAHPVLRDFTDRIHHEDRPAVVAAIDRVMEESVGYSLEYRIVRPNGQIVWAASRAQPVHGPNGKVEGLIGAMLDATERMEAGHSLAKAKEAAEAASRAKDEFLAALSHELRTPLSPVLLLASEGSANESYSREARDDFDVIRKNVALEARLIDDLLDLTRITNGKLALEMQNLDLHKVLLDALTTVRAESEAKEQQLTVDLQAPVCCVRGDSVRLQQVFWNLLRNAVKFTPAAGSIRMVTRETGSHLEIEVADTGYGMTARELATVFDAFAQGEHAGAGGSHIFGGLGLGLTITRMLVEIHGGHISARSEGRHQGSSLTVTLPLVALEERHPIAANGNLGEVRCLATQPSPGFRILLVEDHPFTRQTLTKILTRRGHTVLETGSVADALATAQAHSFDVLISDIGLPDGDGCALMTTLRHERPALIGIAISGYGTDDDLARSAQAGFVTHLTKPVEISLIDRALASLV